VPRLDKPENLRLRAVLDEAGMSNKGLARRIVDLAAARGVAGVRCDHTSVLRWLAGEQPRPPVPEFVAAVLGDALARPVPVGELGMTPGDLPAGLGLDLPLGWTETIQTSTALWRADVQRRRFLASAVFTSAALPASALRWLTSPPAAAPASAGTRRVGQGDIAAIRDLTGSYREIDNRLGGGKLRTVIVSYFDEAYLAARMAQCFRDLGEAGHAARYARRSLDMDGRYVRGRAFNLSLLATAHALGPGFGGDGGDRAFGGEPGGSRRTPPR